MHRRKNSQNTNRKKQMMNNSNFKNNERENENSNQNEQIISLPTHVEDEQEPTISIKQRHKQKSTNKLSDDETHFLSKPQASVAPVKQNSSTTSNNSKSSGYSSSPNNNHFYSSYSSLPPRFQQQRLEKEAAMNGQRRRKRRGPLSPAKSSIPPGSAARPNDFIPLALRQQQQNDDYQTELPAFYEPQQQQQQQQQQYDMMISNDYSSESDVLTDSLSIGYNTSISPLLSTSVDSQSSLQRLDLVRSLATSHCLLDELVSILDTASFSTDELELILNKIALKHISDKDDLQRLLSSKTRHDKTFERIIDETYRSQAKILAIELQTEKNRVLELTKTNGDLENTIRQFQQQPTNSVQYHQMILPYQMQMRRLADENARLQHQLHAYSMMPTTLNELKNQQHYLNEQIRQMTIRNSSLEHEVAESERISKETGENYKKTDAQKQEQIEQMIADINKYKKLDKELTNLRQKHNELEKTLNSKINDVKIQRDQLQNQYEQLKLKIQSHEQPNSNDLQQELNELKEENNQLRQHNWKIMEELNTLLKEKNDNSNPTST